MKILGLIAALAMAAAPAAAITYRVDPAYSAATASVRHWLFFHPVVDFEKVSGEFDYEPGKPEVWKASITVSAASVNTGSPRRDRKLLSSRYLGAAAHPDITFVSTKATQLKGGRVTMEGQLTIKGITHSARFDIEVDQPIEPRLDGRMGLSAHGYIGRGEWKIPGWPLYGGRVELRVLLQGDPASPY